MTAETARGARTPRGLRSLDGAWIFPGGQLRPAVGPDGLERLPGRKAESHRSRLRTTYLVDSAVARDVGLKVSRRGPWPGT